MINVKEEQFVEIKSTKQFREILDSQKPKELTTRLEIAEIIEKLKEKNKPYTIFTVQNKHSYRYLTYGIVWGENIRGFYVLEGNFKLLYNIYF